MKVKMVSLRRLISSVLIILISLFSSTVFAVKLEDRNLLSVVADCEIGKEMLDQIKNKLNLSEKNIESKNFVLSIEYSKAALEMLGGSYVSDGLVDDTGMKLALAKIEEKKNNLEVAAVLYVRILKSRVSLFELK